MTTISKPRFSFRGTEFALAGIAVAFYVILAATTNGSVLSGHTITTILEFLAVPMMVGLSQMAVLAVGQMNLSVGVLTGFSAMICAWLMVQIGLPAWLAVVCGILVGAGIGLINGLLVVLTRINGFIVTLATMTIIDGLRYGVHGTATYQGYSKGLVFAGAGLDPGHPGCVHPRRAGRHRGRVVLPAGRARPATARQRREPVRGKAFRRVQRPCAGASHISSPGCWPASPG